MSRPKERRLKLVRISMELQPDKYSMIAMLRQLPEDATIYRFGSDSYAGVALMVIHSMTFEVVPEGAMLPHLEIYLDRQQLADAQTPHAREYLAPGEKVVVGVDWASQAQRSRLDDIGKQLAETIRATTRGRMTGSQDQPQTLPRCQCDVAYTGGHRPGCGKQK